MGSPGGQEHRLVTSHLSRETRIILPIHTQPPTYVTRAPHETSTTPHPPTAPLPVHSQAVLHFVLNRPTSITYHLFPPFETTIMGVLDASL